MSNFKIAILVEMFFMGNNDAVLYLEDLLEIINPSSIKHFSVAQNCIRKKNPNFGWFTNDNESISITVKNCSVWNNEFNTVDEGCFTLIET
jgi:hypothetical protein